MNVGGDVPPFVSIREAVKLTGLSERDIRARIKAGTAPHIYAGKKALVAIRPFLDSLEAEAEKNVRKTAKTSGHTS